MTISNCGHDENNKYSGGKAGDQTGTEWYVRSWYNGNWSCVLRHPDSNVRAMIADMAKAAANNDHIGYDQSQRLTFWEQLQKVNYKPESITVNCEADCSSGVGAIVKGAGYRLGNSSLKNVSPSIYTGNQKAALTGAGFTCLTDSKYRTSDSYLLAGDILLSGGHTCINLTNGANDSASTAASSSSSCSKTPKNVRQIQSYMNATYGSNLAVDGSFGPASKKAVIKAVQSCIGTAADGSFGPNSQKAWGGKAVKKGTTGELTKLVQIMLLGRGYNIGTMGADGDCGTNTVNAIKRFQGNNGLDVDGSCGKATASVLFKS